MQIYKGQISTHKLMQIIANASNLNALSQSDKNGNNHISNAINIISKIKDTEDVNLDSISLEW